MTEFQRVEGELQALERVHAQLAAVAARTDERRRHDLIELRRRFSQQLADVGRLVDPIFASQSDRALAQTYRDLFSRIRSEAAAHQAKWPAVRIDEESEQYRRSAVAVTEAHRAFLAWTRETLARIAKER